ncbi:hypothetical protein CLV35_3885 [Motilibacter peucedani]|uniref:Uncharacterized protein n=1 Tax=Motilibacter peucedani TaxID=598650 RepID=A0A420XKE2_9ACTN|nr:hypothetical protein [Motilibacter peucedani]RKS67978.1 hypothetical protein CLV35_3885 [Motilibacter peucedani]
MDFEQVLDELFTEPPEGFVKRRDEHARAAKGSGDAALAKRISALHRPTVSAWLVNRLVREDRPAVAQLLALGAQLRKASTSLDADSLRAFSRERHTVVAALGRQAAHSGQAAGGRVTADAVRELEQTLEAALSDEDAAAQVLAGTLVKPLEYAGFGPALGAAGGGAAPVGGGAARVPAGEGAGGEAGEGKGAAGEAAAGGTAARREAERAEAAERKEAERKEAERRRREAVAKAEEDLRATREAHRVRVTEADEARAELERVRAALGEAEERDAQAQAAAEAAAQEVIAAEAALTEARASAG